MIVVPASLILVAIVAFLSSINALGIWLLMLLTHGFIIVTFGSGATHLPMLAGLTILFIMMLKKEIESLHLLSLGLFLGIAGLMTISAFAGLDTKMSLEEIGGYSKGMFLAIVIASLVKDVDQIKTLSIYCLVAIVFGACVTIYQDLTGSFYIDVYSTQRAASLDNDPNVTAMLLCSGLPIALYWTYQASSPYRKALLVISIFLIIAGVALTGSRGGFVTLALTVLVLFIKRPSIPFAACGVLIVIGVAAVAPKTTFERLETLVTGQDVTGASLSNRASMVRDGLKIFIENPLTGVGPGNFPKARFELLRERSRAAAAISSRQPDFGKRAHNMYLQFFAENGIIAGGLFLFILFVPIRGLLLLDRYYESPAPAGAIGIGFAMAISILAILIGCLFLSEAKNAVLWFLVGIGFSSTQIATNYFSREQIRDPESELQSL